jgi:hypothetical protein
MTGSADLYMSVQLVAEPNSIFLLSFVANDPYVPLKRLSIIP